MLRDLGFNGYRLHRRDIPGSPDIAWISRRLAVFIHGCFWHGHGCPKGCRKPKTNAVYWRFKIQNNIRRDSDARMSLKKAGWRTFIIWECELCNRGKIE